MGEIKYKFFTSELDGPYGSLNLVETYRKYREIQNDIIIKESFKDVKRIDKNDPFSLIRPAEYIFSKILFSNDNWNCLIFYWDKDYKFKFNNKRLRNVLIAGGVDNVTIETYSKALDKYK